MYWDYNDLGRIVEHRMLEALGIVAVIAFVAISASNSTSLTAKAQFPRDSLQGVFSSRLPEPNWCVALIYSPGAADV